MRTIRSVVVEVLVAPIRGYQQFISPAYPSTCRFYPSCSTYAIQAVRSRGPVVGVLLAVRRLLKCAPWHPGGFDPVPTRDRSASSRSPQQQELSLVS